VVEGGVHRLKYAWSEKVGLGEGEVVDGACVHACRTVKLFREVWTCGRVLIIAPSDNVFSGLLPLPIMVGREPCANS